MLMEVKNQFKVMILSWKYSLIKAMINKTTFLSNIVFMILNNASFIIQWVILCSIRSDIGGYTFKDILLLWGIAASTYGFAHFFFKNSFDLNEYITNGKLDSFLVQPKNVLLSAITSDIETSAIGDLLYGYIMLFVYGFSVKKLLLFTLFTITGGIVLVCISVILSSLSFWFTKSEMIKDTGNSLMVNFASYPDGIFKGISKLLLYTIVPVGLSTYVPIKLIMSFNLVVFLLVILVTILFIIFTFIIFYKGLKRYSSSNLMIARI